MARKNSMMTGGALWGGLALNGSVAAALTAAGNSQATALALVDDVNIVTTTAASSGVIVPTMLAGDNITISNFGANALAVYPPVGGKLSNAATNTATSLAANKSMKVYCVDALTYAGVVGG